MIYKLKEWLTAGRFRLSLWIMPPGDIKALTIRLSARPTLRRQCSRLCDFWDTQFPPLSGKPGLSAFITRSLTECAKDVAFTLVSGGPLVENITNNNPLLERLRQHGAVK